MAKNNSNYTNGRKSNGRLKAIILAAVAVLVLGGVISAFYSDVFRQNGSAQTETLGINAEYTVSLNETVTPLASITRLNPGDTITVTGSVQNQGSQSAWIRDVVDLTNTDAALLDYIRVYTTELTQEQAYQAELAGENPYAASLLTLSAEGIASNGNRVINGVGEFAQEETGADFEYIGNSAYSFAFTIYLSHTAPNATQNKTLNVSVMTQALQFKNNNAAEPLESAWATVQAIG